ncbi:Ig-like domain-containing protein [Methyloprofundus sp.]|uniref:Ig-like domain-containing protein n=1 Tax=Methyloprofundus sp. TaxID=2020875 RepID=UPI003D138DEA
MANLYGWIDFNSDGIFQPAEAATATVNSTSTVTLTWNAINPVLNPGTPVYARFRLTRTNLSDSGGTAKDERAEGGAGDGEVEDYAILPPTASADTYSVPEDGTVTVAAAGVLANDHDPASKPLTAILVTDVSNGTLNLASNGSFIYTPTKFFSGSDSFTYKANDGSRDSNIVTVTITINHINHAPVAQDDLITAIEDTPLKLPASGVLSNDSDTDVHDTLQASKVADPAHGSLTLNANGSLVYTPDANYNGADSFTYKVNDGHLDSNIATVQIIVSDVNDPSVAQVDSYNTQEDTQLNTSALSGVLHNDRDADGNSITAVSVTPPSHGLLLLQSDGSFKYTPDANFNGTDSFTYKANDGSLDSSVVTVSIRVSAVNDPPVAMSDAYLVHEDTGLSVKAATGLLKNDVDPEHNQLTVKLASNVSHGTLHLNTDGSFDYTPAANYNGTDSFSYQANDGQLDSNTVTVLLSIDAVNDPPLAANDSYTASEDTLLDEAAIAEKNSASLKFKV